MQMETAALKKAGDNRNKVFERKVTAVYTPATLEAGASEDVGELDVAGSDTAQAVTSFLLALSEGLPEGNSGVDTSLRAHHNHLHHFIHCTLQVSLSFMPVPCSRHQPVLHLEVCSLLTKCWPSCMMCILFSESGACQCTLLQQ